MAKEHEINEALYKMICGKRFDKIDKNLEGISELLKGKNGDAGLIEEVRGLKRFHKYVIGAACFLVMTGIAQLIHFLFTKL